ncbi:MAG: aldo/keto reductase [Actinobacteria bacterium]|nr:MAG: aldo/keto reductase [Actinomycetota bacterium]
MTATIRLPTRRIGSLEVPVVGLGCNNFGSRLDEGRTRRVVDAALEDGVTFFDTADIYGRTQSETFLGRILEGRRDRVVIATKFGMEVDRTRRGAAPAYVRRALEDSLRRLRTDRIDLYQLHEPDPATPIADTLEALDGLVREGKVRQIGCSNFSGAQLLEASAAMKEGAARFVSVQNELNLLDRADEQDALPVAEQLGLAYIPYFPLANGLLTGKYRPGVVPEGSRLASSRRAEQLLTDGTFARLEALDRFAVDRGHSILELAFGWLLAHPPVASVIAGATTPEQVRANAAAAGWILTADEMELVAAGLPIL